MSNETDRPPPHLPNSRGLYPGLSAAIAGLLIASVLANLSLILYTWITYGLPSNLVSRLVIQTLVFGIPGAIGGVFAGAISQKLFQPSRRGLMVAGGVGGLTTFLIELWWLAPALFIRSD